ncbi:hypothetical protein [Alkalimarinus coralli]|uniref:hypothetical protein n=1 Tax=Alkalimarinus coralli TaxID=2935863 RepID=UPI00202B78F4|nr:hypothetical protein [Alkalimarinus coralli]
MYIKTTLVLVAFFFSVNVAANCSVKAKTDFERIYCEIVKRGEGKTLPAFEDFKRNDATVQRLLLKRPAQKLKIILPASSQGSAGYASKPHSAETQPRTLASKPQTVATKARTDTPKPLKAVPAPSRRAQSLPDNSLAQGSLALAQCRLAESYIQCGSRRFELVVNKPNNRLAKGVLDDQFLMGLPRYRGPASDDQEIQFYLSEIYSLYIERMIDIGLGGSTMNYARFYHTFKDLQAKGIDFSERFETMYRFLKTDKKYMTVQPVLSDKRPRHIKQCDDVSERIIVCDSDSVNWVYIN